MGVGLALIEAVEEVLQRVFTHAIARIGDGEFNIVAQRSVGMIVVAGRKVHGNVAVVEAVLEGVGEKVGDHLVELSAVNPGGDGP